jgi:hypothetical protein
MGEKTKNKCGAGLYWNRASMKWRLGLGFALHWPLFIEHHKQKQSMDDL